MDPITGAAVGGLDVIIAAALVAVAVVASVTVAWLVGMLIAAVIEQVPGIGGGAAAAIRNGVNSMADAVRQWGESAGNAVVAPLNSLFDSYAGNMRSNAFNGAEVQLNQAAVIAWLARSVTPANLSNTQLWVTQAIDGLLTSLNTEIDTAQNNAVQYAASYGQAIEGWAEQGFAAESAGIAAVGTALQQAETLLSGEITQSYERGITYTQQVYNAATQYTNTAAKSVADTAAADLATERAERESGINAAIGWTEQQVTKEAQRVDGLITPLAATVTALVVPKLADIADTIEKCLDPMCADGPGFFGELGDLFDTAGLVALFALVAEARHNPNGAVGTVSSIAGSVIHDAESTLQSIV